jgi:hypothetical protein
MDLGVLLLYNAGMDLLLTKGRTAIAVRPHLRAFLASKPNRNAYINDLIEKDAQKKASKAPK